MHKVDSQHANNEVLSNVGWAMGMLQELPSGASTWSHSPTIFFEGLDNVGDYRATYGAAETLGEYEVSWAGTSPTGRQEFMAWFKRAGTWFQAGYAEFDTDQADANAQAEATDASFGGTQNTGCLWLSSSATNLHEEGSPTALLVLTDVWHDWTSAFVTGVGQDNNNPYIYQNVSAPNWDHTRVGGGGP